MTRVNIFQSKDRQPNGRVTHSLFLLGMKVELVKFRSPMTSFQYPEHQDKYWWSHEATLQANNGQPQGRFTYDVRTIFGYFCLKCMY